MSLTQVSDRTTRHGRSTGKASIARRRGPEIDRVTVLAILAASAIFAPVALAILNQAAQIFAG